MLVIELQGKSIDALAKDAAETRARLGVTPLAGNGAGGWKGIVEQAVGAASQFAAKFQGGGDNEFSKRAVDVLFRLGEETLNTQVLTNRAMQRRLGLELLSQPPKVNLVP